MFSFFVRRFGISEVYSFFPICLLFLELVVDLSHDNRNILVRIRTYLQYKSRDRCIYLQCTYHNAPLPDHPSCLIHDWIIPPLFLFNDGLLKSEIFLPSQYLYEHFWILYYHFFGCVIENNDRLVNQPPSKKNCC